jgi:hypothetical protein
MQNPAIYDILTWRSVDHLPVQRTLETDLTNHYRRQMCVEANQDYPTADVHISQVSKGLHPPGFQIPRHTEYLVLILISRSLCGVSVARGVVCRGRWNILRDRESSVYVVTPWRMG